MREKMLFDNLIKYSCVMCLHKYHKFVPIVIDSIIKSIGNRKDIEFLVLDDSGEPWNEIENINHIRLPKIDLINKMIMGTQLAKGQYYCNADYDDIPHPQKFELLDNILKYNDIAGANNAVFWDVKTDKTYCLKHEFNTRTHTNKNKTIRFPWLHPSNSAVPLDWLRSVGYDGGYRIGMTHKEGKIMTDSPIWARAEMDGLKFGFIEDWKQCWQIVHGGNINVYNEEQWKNSFKEIKIKKPTVLL